MDDRTDGHTHTVTHTHTHTYTYTHKGGNATSDTNRPMDSNRVAKKIKRMEKMKTKI